MAEYQRCTRCVMDTTDPEITFDSKGVCNHCHDFDDVTSKQWFPNEEGLKQWAETVKTIQREGEGQEYNCILGLSGGVDSSYLALKVFESGLKPLVVHVDAGWNSELAVANIEALVKHCDFDLHTHVVDWTEMQDLHMAFLKAGIANQDVPQDHVIFASLYKFATKNNISTVISGGNIATEAIFPKAWHGSAMDVINLKAIHKKYGSRRLKTYSTVNFFQYYFYFPFIKKMKTVRPLNFMPYNKDLAIKELEEKADWRSYGRKHGESIFTKLFQNHYLPEKFGFDKRLPHFSSLVVSRQMTRDEALKELEKPLYDPKELEIDISYFCKKLRISEEDYQAYLTAPNGHYTDFPTWNSLQAFAKKMQNLLERIRGRKINIYS